MAEIDATPDSFRDAKALALTTRDHIAIEIAAGMMARELIDVPYARKTAVAKSAYDYADAMLEARGK